MGRPDADFTEDCLSLERIVLDISTVEGLKLILKTPEGLEPSLDFSSSWASNTAGLWSNLHIAGPLKRSIIFQNVITP
jgi:hypothetical protein